MAGVGNTHLSGKGGTKQRGKSSVSTSKKKDDTNGSRGSGSKGGGKKGGKKASAPKTQVHIV